MIKVPFPEPTTADWLKWRQDAHKATVKLIAEVAAGRAIKFNEKLYKRMRKEIYAAFHGKCAYCEGHFLLVEGGDVEHYRPKGAVSDFNDVPVPGNLGYYWLAYEWTNLLPSCSKCNRRWNNDKGILVGKGTRFPVDGFRATCKGEEAKEEPLLLHPVLDDPAEHLKFDTATGIIGDRTERGRICIDIFDLNREGLLEQRGAIYIAVEAHMVAMLSALSQSNMVEYKKYSNAVEKHHDGSAAYAMAGRAALRAKKEAWLDELTIVQQFLMNA